ncbi:MAG: T9SS type A sorting domain-containing protein [Bacteroidota bacterium]
MSLWALENLQIFINIFHKKKLLLTFLAICPSIIYAQRYGCNWIGGFDSWAGYPWGNTVLNFTDTSVNVLNHPTDMNFFRSCSIISDSAGTILFYTNGVYIADASDDTMQNGSGLNPSTYTSSLFEDGLGLPQGNLIIPGDSAANEYYLFHVTLDDIQGSAGQPINFYRSTIDISQNGGLGSVINKNEIIFSDTLIAGEITAVKHANGRDWWLIMQRSNSNEYILLLKTPYQILGPFRQSIGGNIIFGSSGQAVFSPDGSRYAHGNAELGGVDVFDFDRCTGLFSNFIHIVNNDTSAIGVAFSKSGQYLYVISFIKIYQYDVTVANIPASEIVVATFDGFADPGPPFYTTFYLGALAPDGKIYVNTSNGTKFFHVIEDPDSLGVNCHVSQHGLELAGYNVFSLPSVLNYNLGPLTGSNCDSLTLFTNEITFDATAIIYPNPSNGKIIFLKCDSPFAHKGKLEIFNVYGINVCDLLIGQTNPVQEIFLPDLTNGIYNARILFNNDIENIKFIVQK